MNTESEKLIEIWMDSATEREYQFGFRSALIFAGYKVLHNTSHTSLELGKDVIAIDPAGTVIAYQLKGNPSGRITISQWQDLIPQINALVYQPLNHPNLKPGIPYQPILVTNGEIHEDVLSAIVAYNLGVEASGRGLKSVKTIARGELLSFFLDHSKKIWPVDLEAQRQILNLLAAKGDDLLPEDIYCSLIERLLGLDSEQKKFKLERIAASHLITAVIAANWQKSKNLFEVTKLYTLLYAKVSAYIARTDSKNKKAQTFLNEIEYNIKQTLVELVNFVRVSFEKRPLVNRDIFKEFPYFHIRKKMLVGLFSVFALDKETEKDEATADFLWSFICKSKSRSFLLGEFIIPYCLANYWAQSNLQGTQQPDIDLSQILGMLLFCNSSENVRGHLPGPYYTPTEIIEWAYQEFLGVRNADLAEDNHHERSWFAEPLFFLLVRRNLKRTCQAHWYALTKFLHVETKLKSDWEFGVASSDDAQQQDKQLRVPQSWNDVVKTASVEIVPNIPEAMLAKPLLVLLYCLFVPYRMNYEVIMWLDRKLNPSSWY